MLRFFTNPSFAGGAFPVVARVDLCFDQARINQHKGESEAREPSAGNGGGVEPETAWRRSPQARLGPKQAAGAFAHLAQ